MLRYTAVLRGQFAAEWKQYEADADIMPNLRWMHTTSATPDEEHKGYWMNRLTLPVGDKFWNEHHPGDHWNCKCSLEQTDEPSNGHILSEIPNIKAQKGLKANPGKAAVIFDKTHPYFADSCAKCPFKGSKSLKNVFVNEGKHCENCQSIDKCMEYKKKIDRARAKILKKEAEFLTEKTLFNESFPHEVSVSNRNIKEWLNQPHDHYYEKNEMILKLDEVYANATYVGIGKNVKGKKDVIDCPLFEIRIAGEPSWIILHHMTWGGYQLYGVSGNKNVLNSLIE